MLSLAITPEEVASGVMSDAHREAAVQAIREDGVVVLENVVDLEHLAVLRDKMITDVDALLARPNRPFNWNAGNLQQMPPPLPPYLFKDVLLNDMAIAVTHAVLGNGVQNDFYSGNTAVKSDERQPVHADMGQLWHGLEVATPPYAIVVNVPTVDMTPENGSTEIWPGTHLDTTVAVQDGEITLPEDVLEKRRQVSLPLQPTVKAGSIVLRDLRMWHAGMPNRTDKPRPMIAMIHWVGWWGCEDNLQFPKGTEAFFEHPVLRTRARFVEGEIDYIHASDAYAYEEAEGA